MREKKQFFIPKNYDKKFEWIPGISGWQHIAFAPVVALDYVILQYTPFSFANKITMIAVSLGFPWALMGVHPVRENVSLWQHLLWKLKFMARQKLFQYKKEGYKNVENVQEVKVNIRAEQVGEEKAGSGKKISARLDSDKSNRGRIPYNTRQQNDSTAKSISR